MIEVKTLFNDNNQKCIRLVIDGEVVAHKRAKVIFIGANKFYIYIAPKGFERIADRKFSDFPHEMSRIIIYDHRLSLGDLFVEAVIQTTESGLELRFKLSFLANKWKHPWSISEYVKEFWNTANSMNIGLSIREYKYPANSGNFEAAVAYRPEGTFGEIITDIAPIVNNLHNATVAALETKVANGTIISYFEFPKEVTVACEQYLVYFVQFLKDLGVEATADLSHEAGKLLFAVKPDSQEVALEQIREALNVYLQLPANSSIGLTAVPVGEIQLQQLIANVQHLQGQLRLSYATIQQQDVTISQRQDTIANLTTLMNVQQKILTGEVLSYSLQPPPASREKPEREEFWDGIIAFTKVEKFGVEISLAEIMRRLRSSFAEKLSYRMPKQLPPPKNLETAFDDDQK